MLTEKQAYDIIQENVIANDTYGYRGDMVIKLDAMVDFGDMFGFYFSPVNPKELGMGDHESFSDAIFLDKSTGKTFMDSSMYRVFDEGRKLVNINGFNRKESA